MSSITDPTSFRIALPIILGAGAVFCLFPRLRPASKYLGTLLGTGALVLIGVFMLGDATRAGWIESILFYSFSALAIAGGVLLITQPNPARGAVAFALVVLNVCGLFLLQGAPFLMAGTIIIYAGAIVVTFLFVIMLDFQLAPTDADTRVREPVLACLTGAILLALLVTACQSHFDKRGIDQVLATIDATLSSNSSGKLKFEDVTESINHLGMNSPFKSKLAEMDDEFGPRIERAATPDEAKAELRRFREAVRKVRHQVGDIPPPEYVPLSDFAGMKKAEALPAANVAALGRALFSEYLLAVELGGALLLVATIGAIAITHRAPKRAAE